MSLLSEFIAEVKTGIARSNRYEVSFTSPRFIDGADPNALRKTLLFCDQVQLPGLNISSFQNRTFGEFREAPYEKLFDNINMSFYVDHKMEVKVLFDTWMAKIQDPYTRKFKYYREYTTDMTIKVQDTENITRYEVKLFECYPKSVGTIQLDYAAKDIMKLPVNMQYKYWISGQVNTLLTKEKERAVLLADEQSSKTHVSPDSEVYEYP